MFKRKRDIAYSAAMLCNHISVIALLLSYAAPYISPANMWIFAFIGLTYPLWVLVNVFFIILWMILIPKRALYSFVVLICGFNQMTAFVQLNNDSDEIKPKESIKVMSYNVRLFDLYNWSHNTETRNLFFKLIKDESPDIMCLQEFYTSESTYAYKLNNLDTLLKFQKAKNVFTQYTITLRNTDHWGGAIFSAYPILNKGNIKIDNNGNNLCMYCDVLINKDTVRVYNLHLQSIHFKKDDYKFWDDLINNTDTLEVEKSKNILRRMKAAYIKRATHADTVASHIKSSPYPVIVCGDFNDTPSSYVYQKIVNAKKMNDAFMESGNGLGRTYGGKFPSFRIDYILYSDNYEAHHFSVIEESFSDHYPITSYLQKK
jgi:endonuclease/exonuclease/phosphatase family metal-dependent hydrolase